MEVGVEFVVLGLMGGRMLGWWLYVSVVSGVRVVEEE